MYKISVLVTVDERNLQVQSAMIGRRQVRSNLTGREGERMEAPWRALGPFPSRQSQRSSSQDTELPNVESSNRLRCFKLDGNQECTVRGDSPRLLSQLGDLLRSTGISLLSVGD